MNYKMVVNMLATGLFLFSNRLHRESEMEGHEGNAHAVDYPQRNPRTQSIGCLLNICSLSHTVFLTGAG